MVLERFNDLVFEACVHMLGELPSRALKGVSMNEMLRLVDLYRKQGVAIKDMFK